MVLADECYQDEEMLPARLFVCEACTIVRNAAAVVSFPIDSGADRFVCALLAQVLAVVARKPMPAG